MVLKPSEVSAATDGVIAELIPKYLSQVKFVVLFLLVKFSVYGWLQSRSYASFLVCLI